jgi:hypothetical protein
MVRPLRIEHPGGWSHVTARGNERRAIFRQDRDRVHFLEPLESDWGRELLLYLGKRRCGMKLKELAAESGLASEGAVAREIKRYGNKLARDSGEAVRMNNLIQLNVTM